MHYEIPKNPIEALKEELSTLVRERDFLKAKVIESGENIYVELGSEEYVDFGYSARLEEVEPRIAEIEAELREYDDAQSRQRNLNL